MDIKEKIHATTEELLSNMERLLGTKKGELELLMQMFRQLQQMENICFF